MKKIILLSATMLASIVLLVSFSSKKKTTTIISQASSSVINCAPPENSITAAAFEAKYLYNRALVRKNVDNLSTSELNAIKTGIANMKALPYTNRTSWAYQSAIHGTSLTDNLPSWNSCHKTGETFFFLAWHRMYVYFFERILRAKSGSSKLTLPYWNYQTDPVLHPAFRDNNPNNPLYDITRSVAINSGGSLPASIMTAFSNSMNYIPFYDFQSSMNNGPHGSVHTSIGGNMGLVATAAKDPIFWIHHANIDRLWEEWLRKCNGRTNPVDTAFLNKTYTFFDENGTAVSMKGSQVLKTSSQLNYTYDFSGNFSGCPPVYTPHGRAQKQVLVQKTSLTTLDGRAEKARFAGENSSKLDLFIKANKKTSFDFKSATAPEKLIVSFSGIIINKMPVGVVEIYLNLPECESPNAENRHFAGLLDLFSAEHHSNHGPAGEQEEFDLDISKVAKDIGLTPADLKNAELSFVVRGNTLEGREVLTEAKVRIRQIKFSISQIIE